MYIYIKLIPFTPIIHEYGNHKVLYICTGRQRFLSVQITIKLNSQCMETILIISGEFIYSDY